MKNLILTLALILFLVSCKEESTCPCTKQEIKIGVLLPLTGTGQSAGETQQAAINYAKTEINKYFDEKGYKKIISLYIEDTGTNPDSALSKLKLLADKGIKFVVGPYSSAEVSVVKDYANQNGIMLVSPSSVAISLAIAGDNVYRLSPSDVEQSLAMAKLLEDDGITTIIPIIRDDVWGNDLLNAVRNNFTAAGGKVPSAVKYDPVTTDFSVTCANTISRLNNELSLTPASQISIYMASFSEGSAILEKASEMNDLSLVKWYGSSAFANNSSLLNNSAAAAFANSRDLLCPIFGFDDNSKNIWEPISNSIQTLIGRKPDIYALVAYDIMWLAAKTYLITGYPIDITNLKTVFEQQANIYVGATGATNLNEYGDRAEGNYDFWGLKQISGGYSWDVFARYITATGVIVRY